ncbi:MAG: hypothetical protein HYS22_01105 [Deltaproteobacteria bacterium]|nr:hypothetical protein [Deltaproteobacteria bacterium]
MRINTRIKRFLFFSLFFFPLVLHAEERTPQWFSLELKGGFWLPQDKTTDSLLGLCCHGTIGTEFGFLWQSKFGAEIGVGFLKDGGHALGKGSGRVSGDTFDLLLLPMKNNFTFRADFQENQIVVPYVKSGFDYVYYRENLEGKVTQGLKTGYHGTAGVQFLMEFAESLTHEMEQEMGINDLYLTLEGQFAKVDSFGKTGLDLSGWTLQAGLLFEF